MLDDEDDIVNEYDDADEVEIDDIVEVMHLIIDDEEVQLFLDDKPADVNEYLLYHIHRLRAV